VTQYSLQTIVQTIVKTRADNLIMSYEVLQGVQLFTVKTCLIETKELSEKLSV